MSSSLFLTLKKAKWKLSFVLQFISKTDFEADSDTPSPLDPWLATALIGYI